MTLATDEDVVLNDSDRQTRDNLIRVVRLEGIPRCFDSRKQYDGWLEVEKTAATEPFRRNVCDDCTKGFKLRMIAAGRCVNKHQEVRDEE